MSQHPLRLPSRPAKPRRTGVTSLIDPGVPLGVFEDVMRSHGELVDYVKLGWGTALVTPQLQRKLELARAHEVIPYLGGTLFEKAWLEGELDWFRGHLKALGLDHVELSNGVVDLGHEDKSRLVERFAAEFTVLAEVGYKDNARSLKLHPARWIEHMTRDLEAGARFAVAEARESGTSGVCRADGEVRFGLIEEILASDLPVDRLMFEAPNKGLHVYFIDRVGSDVNLANVGFGDAIGVETLRLGLRADTLLRFEEGGDA